MRKVVYGGVCVWGSTCQGQEAGVRGFGYTHHSWTGHLTSCKPQLCITRLQKLQEGISVPARMHPMLNSGSAAWGGHLAGPRKMAVREKRVLRVQEPCEGDLGGGASRRHT